MERIVIEVDERLAKPFFVIDTNCFVSANLIKNSKSAKAFDTVLNYGIVALSNEIFNEYTEVLYRKNLINI